MQILSPFGHTNFQRFSHKDGKMVCAKLDFDKFSTLIACASKYNCL